MRQPHENSFHHAVPMPIPAFVDTTNVIDPTWDESTIRPPKTSPQRNTTPEFDEATIKARPERSPLVSKLSAQLDDATVRPVSSNPRGNVGLFREVLDKVAREARTEEKRLEAERKRAADVRRQREAEEARQRRQAELAAHAAAHALCQYDVAWKALGAGRVHAASLSLAQFPWPVLHAVRSADDISTDAVYDFLFNVSAPVSTHPKERLKQEILRWHPDKFNTKVVQFALPADRARILDIAGRVARVLNELKARMDRPAL